MSGSIFGRVQHSRAAPIAIPPQVVTPATRDSACDCACTGDAETGVNGAGVTVTPGHTFEDWTPELACDGTRATLCSSDMAASFTVTQFSNAPDFAGGQASVVLGVRFNVAGNDGYQFSFRYNLGSTGIDSHAGQFLLVNVNTLDVLGSSTFPTAMDDGDTMGLSAIGSSIVATHNGSPVFSVTDTSVAASEQTTFGYYAVGVPGSATSDTIISSFSVTPTC